MAFCYIEFECIQQDLKRTDARTVAADAAGTVTARFKLCSKWDGLNVFARFQHGAAVYDVPLENNEAVVPWEILKPTGFHVSIFGEDESGARLTSARIFVDVAETIPYTGAEPIPATPSLLQRFELAVQACNETAASLREDADSGKFNGTPFRIVKQYGSVAEMEADQTGFVQTGEFVCITSGVEDPDNAKLYLRTEYGWIFITDMSGAQGVGIKGDKGDAGTIEVGTVTTGASGTTAAVENVGTSTSAIFNFTLPKGDKGDKGDGVPDGGSAGQVLTKTDAGVEWAAAASGLPEGGSANQYLKMTDSGAAWSGIDATNITTGTLPTNRGGTGLSVANSSELTEQLIRKLAASPYAVTDDDIYFVATQENSSWWYYRQPLSRIWHPFEVNIRKSFGFDENNILSVEHGGTGGTSGGGSSTPAGIISAYAGTTAPEGYLICDGAAVSRTTYAALFEAIGTTYGDGNGSTTFNVPNLLGRVPVGAGTPDGHVEFTLGAKAGEVDHTLTVEEMPQHYHDTRRASPTNENKGRLWTTSAGSGSGWELVGTSGSSGNDDVVTGYTGGSAAHNNMQPYTVVNYIISTGQ